MFNNLIGKNKELGRFLFCERYTLPPVKNAMYIAEGQELKRGAVVDVNGVLVGTNSLMPYAVLEFDCDTRSGGKEASVFIKGEFNFDKLYFADGLEKSDLDNIVYNGSGLGIVIKPYTFLEGFEPNVGGYRKKTLPPIFEGSTIKVSNKDAILVSYVSSGIDLTIDVDENCNDASVLFQRGYNDINSLSIKKSGRNIPILGRETITSLDVTKSSFLKSLGSGAPESFEEIGVTEGVSGVTGKSAIFNIFFLVEIKPYCAIIHYQ